MRSLLVVTTLAAGCASSPAPQPQPQPQPQPPPLPRDLQMNDLSVLVPLPQQQAELDAMLVEDAGVHAFYALTRDQLIAATDELVNARKADTGDLDLGPLAPHPTIVREGLQGALAQSFLAILTKYAGAANLVRFTELEVNENAVRSDTEDGDGGGAA